MKLLEAELNNGDVAVHFKPTLDGGLNLVLESLTGPEREVVCFTRNQVLRALSDFYFDLGDECAAQVEAGE